MADTPDNSSFPVVETPDNGGKVTTEDALHKDGSGPKLRLIAP